MTVIRLKINQNVQHGEFNIEVMNKDLQLDEEEMRELKMDKSKSKEEGSDLSSATQGAVEYCESCFLAFGSQEQRVNVKGKTVHENCAQRLEAA